MALYCCRGDTGLSIEYCVCVRVCACVVLSCGCLVVSLVACLIGLLMLAPSYHFVWHVGRHIIGGERKKCVGNTAHNCMFVCSKEEMNC